MPNKIKPYDNLAKNVVAKLKSYTSKVKLEYTGKVIELADCIARVSGLSEVSYSEMVEFENGVFGVAINLEESQVGTIILGDYLKIRQGDQVKGTGRLLSVPVGEALIGRVIDPLGNPLDGKGKLKAAAYNPLEKIAPGVTERQPVNTPLQTGIKAIDSMIPIGRGQRELIIGDRSTGKTAIVVDTIINQKNENVICIYVVIGQKASRVAQVVDTFQKYGAFDHTIIVAASASAPSSVQFLAPYAGCAIGEYFMEKGQDALVVYDDLSKHAWAYREISLLLKRPSGREAYPGDIFYLHSRLLERSARMSNKKGGGSLTALPIIETQAGDLSAYIPTNVISITDGQIYLEPDLFYAGIRPAINVGLSVSRVGGAAQNKAMKQVAGRLRLDLAQYRELAAFAQFATDLDKTTRAQIERGSRMIEILKQPQFTPMPVEKQIVLIYAGTAGFVDDIDTSKIAQFETEFLEFLETQYKDIMRKIKEEKALNKETEESLKKAIDNFKKQF